LIATSTQGTKAQAKKKTKESLVEENKNQKFCKE
jgi:hypothetical protein